MRTLLIALFVQLQIPAPVGYVNDFAGIIDPSTSQQMQSLIEEVRQKSGGGGEIVVVTMADLGGRASIDVGRDIIRQWKIGGAGGAGDKGRNAATVLLLKPGKKPGDGQADFAIVTGTGAEGFITDALAGQIRREAGQASVDAGRYDMALLRGVQLLSQAYAREFGFDLTGAAGPPVATRGRSPGGFPAGLIPFLLVLFFLFLMFRRRRGGLLSALLWSTIFNSGRGRGGWGGGGWGGGGWGGGGGGFGGFGGGGGSMGGGSSGRF